MNNLITWIQDWTDGGKLAILLFFPMLIALLYSSIRIVKYSEIIMSKTKIGSSFFGGAVLAIVTSIPELITEVTQASAGTPENGIGDDIGSNAFSAFLIGISVFLFIRYRFLKKLGNWTIVSIFLSFLVAALLSVFLYIGKDANLKIIGIIPLIFFIIYLVVIFLSYKFSDEDHDELPDSWKKFKTNHAYIWFFVFSSFVIVLSVFINADVSAFQRGHNISTDSIGGLFLAVTTSLPEIVIFILLLKSKKPAAAMASLIGSHIFNIGISFFGDLTYTSGPTFNRPEMQSHYPLAILTAIMMFLLFTQILLLKKNQAFRKNKFLNKIIPSIMIMSYILGWAMILIFN